MAALTNDRPATTERDLHIESYAVAASTTIYAGGMVALNGSGNAVAAADTSGLRVAGVANEHVDNSAGAAGDKNVEVISGRVFKVAVTGTAITDADVGEECYVADDQTVQIAKNTNDVPAGVIVQGGSTTADVFIPHPGFRIGKHLGNQTIGGTLAVTGASTLTGNVSCGGTLAVTGVATFTAEPVLSAGIQVADDQAITLGDDDDATITYDETTDDRLEITCATGIALSGAVTLLTDSVLADGVDIAVDTTTGSKIGTAAAQKLGLWGATPVVQQSHIADSGGDDATAVNAILAALEAVGILATS